MKLRRSPPMFIWMNEHTRYYVRRHGCRKEQNPTTCTCNTDTGKIYTLTPENRDAKWGARPQHLHEWTHSYACDMKSEMKIYQIQQQVYVIRINEKYTLVPENRDALYSPLAPQSVRDTSRPRNTKYEHNTNLWRPNQPSRQRIK